MLEVGTDTTGLKSDIFSSKQCAPLPDGVAELACGLPFWSTIEDFVGDFGCIPLSIAAGNFLKMLLNFI